jgi:Rrf2 family protein
MFKINKKIEYALMVLKHLQSHPTTLATARQVCEIYHCPFDSTSKVMQIMASHNILASVQGVKGGYRLTADLNSLSYLYLAQIIEGKSFEHNCTELDCSLIESCNITAPVSRLNDYLTDFFQTITIRDLLEDRLTPLEIIQHHESVL